MHHAMFSVQGVHAKQSVMHGLYRLFSACIIIIATINIPYTLVKRRTHSCKSFLVSEDFSFFATLLKSLNKITFPVWLANLSCTIFLLARKPSSFWASRSSVSVSFLSWGSLRKSSCPSIKPIKYKLQLVLVIYLTQHMIMLFNKLLNNKRTAILRCTKNKLYRAILAEGSTTRKGNKLL